MHRTFNAETLAELAVIQAELDAAPQAPTVALNAETVAELEAAEGGRS